MTDGMLKALNETPGLVGPPLPPPSTFESAHAFYTHFVANDGAPFWPVWENLRRGAVERWHRSVRSHRSPLDRPGSGAGS